MQPSLFPHSADEPDVHVCFNCDTEFAVNKIADDYDMGVQFCPFCGEDLLESDDDDEEE